MNRLDTLDPAQEPRRAAPQFIGSLTSDPAASAGGVLGRDKGAALGDNNANAINVGQSERTASVIGGAALIGLGLLRGRASGLALAGLGALVVRRGLKGHCEMYGALGINTTDDADGRPDRHAMYDKGVKIREAATVMKPADELYDFWRDFKNLPRFMTNVERVDVQDDGERSHWVIKGPAGTTVEYDAEIINEEPGRLIAWQSVGGADVQHAGSVRFLDAPGDKGTEVHLNIEYLPPAGFLGKFGAKVLRLVGQAPQNDVRQSLRQFKQLMEAGELATNEGCPQGSC